MPAQTQWGDSCCSIIIATPGLHQSLLAERGIVIAQGITKLRTQLPRIVEDEANELTPLSREVMRELYEELVALDERVTRADAMVHRVFTQSAACQKLAQVEGIGPVVATALVAAVGNAQEFANGRRLAAWLGLVPRQHSTGGKERLRGISKRGDRYVRTLLIHGARATVHRAPQDRCPELLDRESGTTPREEYCNGGDRQQECPDCLGTINQ